MNSYAIAVVVAVVAVGVAVVVAVVYVVAFVGTSSAAVSLPFLHHCLPHQVRNQDGFRPHLQSHHHCC